ncbi:MAG: bifunctional phosphoglucose/phosphomannose isomerase [Candidatus Saccharibacteria bacterium]|nr:bifunctional phosphoglucose/phosphomannose isomerase [Candidatus Saccharibacteria bacterium]
MGNMLDDIKYIHDKDKSDALGITEKQAQQLLHEFDLPEMKFPVDNIVFAGMGGSALAATLSLSWPGYNLPFEICRNYDVPAYVSDKTLFIASSYSGNTEETISALKQAADKGAHVAVISAGGKLAEIAKEHNYPLAQLPSGIQPRHAVLYNFKALITILERAGITANDKTENELHEAAKWLSNQTADWLPTVPTAKNPAKRLAQECMGRSPVIYAGPKLYPAAYKWKINFNENAKNVAWCNAFPEFNHNEFLGWSSHPVDKPYTVIDLRSDLEHERVQKRFEVTERLLSGKRPAPEIVQAKGSTLLEQLLWTMMLGDFVSMYLGLLNGLDPAPVDLIEKFKKQLNK